MPVSFDHIEAAFIESVKAAPAFAGWRKKGKRIFWHQAGLLHYGVELMRFKGSFEKTQWVGVCAFVSWSHPETPSGYVSPEIWKDGRIFSRAYLVPNHEMTREPTLGNGAVVKLCEPEEVQLWSSGLPQDFSRLLAPWLHQAANEMRS